jgi:hypothetical protein
MNPESINFVNYNKISQESDAFIFSDQFIPYFELEISGNFNADSLDLEKYTAGTTDNPEDYSLSNVDYIVNPQKLSRINPFNKNSKELIYSLKDSDESIKPILSQHDVMSEDAIVFFNFINNRDDAVTKKKTTENHVFISKAEEEFEEFVINQRFFSNMSNSSIEETKSSNIQEIKEDGNSSTNVYNEYKNNTIVKKNKYDYRTILEDSRVNEINKQFSYDIYNSESKSVYDFTTSSENNTVINEVKNELIVHMDQKINNLENKIFNQNITRNEINQIENKIIQVIESKLQKTEDQIIEKIDERSTEKINKFKNNFLNS